MDNLVQSQDSRNKNVCSMFDRNDWYCFTWKIPNFSSIPYAVDYEIKSPSFFFQDASWIFKIYPYGQRQFLTEGYIDVVIERLHSEIPEHRMVCRIIVPGVEEIHKCYRFVFYSEFAFSNANRLMTSFVERVSSGTFILNFQFGLFDNLDGVVDHDLELKKSAIGKRDKNEMEGKLGIGEVIEHLLFKTFSLKVYDIPGNPPAGYHAPSPIFYFAGASWILKIWPHCLESSNEWNFSLTLERHQSEISDHDIMLEVDLVYPNQKKFNGSFSFDSCHTREEVLHFSCDCFQFCFKMEMKIKNDVVESDTGNGINDGSGTLQNLKQLFLTQEGSDVVIKVSGQEFRAHRAILSAQSPVFAASFRNDMRERATGIFHLEDFSNPSAFTDFLCFLYCGEIENLCTENAFSLFALADKYDVSGLRMKCIEFIKQKLSIDTFCDTISLALLHSEKELIKFSTDFFRENLQKIIVTDKWESFVVENPRESNKLMINALVPNGNVK